MSNLPPNYHVPLTPQTRIHKVHSLENVIGDVKSGVKTRQQLMSSDQQGLLDALYASKQHEFSNSCLFVCFLSQAEPKNILKALDDSSWVEAMQEELF